LHPPFIHFKRPCAKTATRTASTVSRYDKSLVLIIDQLELRSLRQCPWFPRGPLLFLSKSSSLSSSPSRCSSHRSSPTSRPLLYLLGESPFFSTSRRRCHHLQRRAPRGHHVYPDSLSSSLNTIHRVDECRQRPLQVVISCFLVPSRPPAVERQPPSPASY
jgi:hypothetical protein